ncbi:MAG: SapC family protein [Desulfobacteraceae bacterium]|nr:SapC family protein [Desulfobacteraceae bacterium]
MPQLAAITKESHAGKSWKRFQSYNFASKDNLAPLAGAEVAKAVLTLPMAFVKQQDTFSLVAVLSLAPGTNLFTGQNGRWLGGYVPAVFRGYPFLLAKAEGRDDLILCVHEDSGLILDDKSAEPFFDDQGQVSPPVQEILNFLSRIEQNKAITNQAVSVLADAGLITEWPLKIKEGEQEKPVTGLYMVDEAKLNTLEDELFLKLRKAGSLPIAYGQLLSMGNIQAFEKLADMQTSQARAAAEQPDFKAFLGDDDVISFE